MANDNYNFLPFIKQGLATQLTGPVDNFGSAAGTGVRASITLNVDLEGAADFQKDVHLIGPGDIERINESAIMRHAPIHGESDFLPNFMAFIDFFEEDFPWRYTPLKPYESDGPGQHKLRPWLSLVVLNNEDNDDREFNEIFDYGAPNRVIELANGKTHGEVFPDETQIWAWAHVQAFGEDMTTYGATYNPETHGPALKSMLNQEPYRVISRIMCPRKLKPSTKYSAFLIPSFELGRKAGLGEDITGTNLQESSWSVTANPPNKRHFPVYYTWNFTTGTSGDFEALLMRIKPGQPHPDLGRIPLNITEPNHPDLNGVATQSYINMGGALKQAGVPQDNFLVDNAAFTGNLQDLINLGSNLNQNAPQGLVDPVISTPLYGRWHAAQSTITNSSPASPPWIDELNLDPKYRSSAGVGTKVVKENQQSYMEMAWKQVGSVNEANRRLAFTQLSYVTTDITYNKYFQALPSQVVLQATANAHPVIKDSVNANSVKVSLENSRVPSSMTDIAFSSWLRPNSPVMRKAKLAPGSQYDIMNNVAIAAVKPVADREFPPSRASVASALSGSQLTASSIDGTSARSNFVLLKPDAAATGTWSSGGGDSAHAAYVRSTTGVMLAGMEDTSAQYSVPTDALDITMNALKEEVNAEILPSKTFSAQASSWLKLKGGLLDIDVLQFNRVMAAPSIDLPMYEALRDYSKDFIIPNFHLVEENTVTLLETNNKFIESFLVGMNHEMSRELLWNEYPTDQRGSYFRNFWASDKIMPPVEIEPSLAEKAEFELVRDIDPIHTWNIASELGTHNAGHNNAEANLVFVLKADLVKKFPNLFVYAVPGKWVNKNGANVREPDFPDPSGTEMLPSFFAKMPPDTVLLGFDLTASEAIGSTIFAENDPGWFFCIEERVGDLRFGLDVAEDSFVWRVDDWNNLTWGHIGTNNGSPGTANTIHNYINVSEINIDPLSDPDPDWGNSAANMARIFYQPAVRVSIHADDMITF